MPDISIRNQPVVISELPVFCADLKRTSKEKYGEDPQEETTAQPTSRKFRITYFRYLLLVTNQFSFVCEDSENL